MKNAIISLCVIALVMAFAIAKADESKQLRQSSYPVWASSKEYENIPNWCLSRYHGQAALDCVEMQQKAFIRSFDYVGCKFGGTGKCIVDPSQCIPLDHNDIDWTSVESCVIGESQPVKEAVTQAIEGSIQQVYQSPVRRSHNGRQTEHVTF